MYCCYISTIIINTCYCRFIFHQQTERFYQIFNFQSYLRPLCGNVSPDYMLWHVAGLTPANSLKCYLTSEQLLGSQQIVLLLS